MSTNPRTRQFLKPIALLAAVLLGGCDMGDGFCYSEWKRLSAADFCELVDRDDPERFAKRLSCNVEFGKSNELYATAELSYSDPTICAGWSCGVVFDTCGHRVRV